jgi:aminocarboxymuconate-semialdehyde decarboxylase
MVIDAYTHFFPAAYQQRIERSTTRAHPDVPNLQALKHLFPNLCELESRLRHMDKHGIEIQVLTPLPIPVELFIGERDGETGDGLARAANDALAEAISKQNDRFLGVALLSFSHIEHAVVELTRTIEKLGFVGAMLFTNIEGQPLDSPSLRPLYERAVKLDVPLWLHPVSWNYYPWVREYLIWQIFGWPIDTTLAMARIVYGGVFDLFPELKIIAHHAGGAVPPLFGRVVDTYDQYVELERLSTADSAEMNVQPSNPVQNFAHFYADTAVSGSVPALRAAVDVFGAGHVLYGSDYPFGPDTGQRFIRANLDAVRTLQLSPADTTSILSETCRALLHRGPLQAARSGWIGREESMSAAKRKRKRLGVGPRR